MVKRRNLANSRKEKTIYQKKRKTYLKPELVIYGQLEKLTEGAGQSGADTKSKRL